MNLLITSKPLFDMINAKDQKSDGTAIDLKDVDIRYRMLLERTTSFKEYALNRIKGKNSYTQFWALREVSITVNKGESIGVIGDNGAGKSTLLRVIARILNPTNGQAVIQGTVTPILELGALFDSELTGRENIYLNGAMYGYSRDVMNGKLDSLLDFAGIGDFIDSPLRTYSNGMIARLAFAISTDVDADIVLIDEVLAVGDNNFQEKCISRMETFNKKGTTLVTVSHNLGLIQKLCSRVIWMEHGRIKADGNPGDIIPEYQKTATKELFDKSQAGTP
jgi:ABC-2 type transport system ATP-binding protein/lipopolysaccharide transport system ATP-binding protein